MRLPLAGPSFCDRGLHREQVIAETLLDMNYINKYSTLCGGGRERGKEKKELCERQKQRERDRYQVMCAQASCCWEFIHLYGNDRSQGPKMSDDS